MSRDFKPTRRCGAARFVANPSFPAELGAGADRARGEAEHGPHGSAERQRRICFEPKTKAAIEMTHVPARHRADDDGHSRNQVRYARGASALLQLRSGG
jgi:hypothetical protein